MTMFGGYGASSQDVPPYMTLVGVRPFGIVGLNTIGLRRNGVSREGRIALKRAFHVLYGGARRAMAEILPELDAIDTPEVRRLANFIPRRASAGSCGGGTARGAGGRGSRRTSRTSFARLVARASRLAPSRAPLTRPRRFGRLCYEIHKDCRTP